MDICIPNTKYEYNTGLDSNTVSEMINFNDSFIKYFPEGIKMFSSITEVGWIIYDYDFDNTIIEYSARTKDGRDYFVTLSDSLSYFQKKSDSDFLFVIHNITTVGNALKETGRNSNSIKDYESIISGQYSIWNTKNSDLVVQDIVTTKMKFKKLAGKWPYRGVVLKLAYEIFDKLPMFAK